VVISPQNASKESNPTFHVEAAGPNGLQSATKVFMIINCIFSGIATLLMTVLWLVFLINESTRFYSITFLIALFIILTSFVFTIYMTNTYSHKIETGTEVGIAFKIVTLLFFDLICGILMLCDNNN
jgi:hypothetical protein